MPDLPIPSDATSGSTPAAALVILPFSDIARAESFVLMLNANRQEGTSAIVTLGTAYEWSSEEQDSHGQVVKFRAGWEVFYDSDEPETVLLQRVTKEAEEASGGQEDGADQAGA